MCEPLSMLSEIFLTIAVAKLTNTEIKKLKNKETYIIKSKTLLAITTVR